MEGRVLDSEGPTAHRLHAQQTLLAPLTPTAQSLKERRRVEIRGKFRGSSVGKERDAEGCSGSRKVIVSV